MTGEDLFREKDKLGLIENQNKHDEQLGSVRNNFVSTAKRKDESPRH